MKKCPYCNAEIEDNARFCLYCMASLDNKEKINNDEKQNKIGPVIIVAVVIAVLLVICLWFALKESNDDTNYPVSSIEGIFSQSFFEDTDSDSKSSETQTSQEAGFDASLPEGDSSDSQSEINSEVASSSGNTGASSSNEKSDLSSGSENSSITPSVPGNNIDDNTSSDVSDTSNVESSIAPDTPDTNGAVYAYRTAQVSDAICEGRYTLPQDAIVITKVTQPSNNGVYRIPETIDGKPVVALMDNIFGDENIKNTVKTVIIPACIKEIRGIAFYYCYNLTEIYIEGDYIFFPNSGLFAPVSKRTGTLTIYASANCEDKTSISKVKYIATYNDAKFVEWNE